jgi:hypothetical protein
MTGITEVPLVWWLYLEFNGIYSAVRHVYDDALTLRRL